MAIVHAQALAAAYIEHPRCPVKSSNFTHDEPSKRFRAVSVGEIVRTTNYAVEAQWGKGRGDRSFSNHVVSSAGQHNFAIVGEVD